MEFNKMNLPACVIDGLNSQNITNLTGIQDACIPKILEGKDIVGQSQTGSGKTFAYGIPAICSIDESILRPQVLIICPTRELAVQVCTELKNITKNSSIKTVPVFGGSDMSRQIVALKKCHIVVGTPGRLMDHLRRRTLKLNELKMLVLDEADEMLNMGFKEDIETILKDVPKTKQMIMFSATMPRQILELTKNYMNNPEFIKINNGNDNQSFVEQYYLSVGKNQKNEAVLHLINTQRPKTLIIFCNTKRMVDNLCEFLKKNNVDAVCMHGDKRQSERKRILDGIKNNGEGILIGTDVLARGIDISNVDAVYNFDMPQNSEYYIHRIGRTARAGKQGKSITIVNTRKQMADLKILEKATRNKIVELSSDSRFVVIRDEEPFDNERKSDSRRNNRTDNRSDSRNKSRSRFGRSSGGFKKDREKSADNKNADKRSPSRNSGRSNFNVKHNEKFGEKTNRKFAKTNREESFSSKSDKKDSDNDFFNKGSKEKPQTKKSYDKKSNSYDNGFKKSDTTKKYGKQTSLSKSKFADKSKQKDTRKFDDRDKDSFNGNSTKVSKYKKNNFKQFLK